MIKVVVDTISPVRNAVELGAYSGAFSALLSHLCTGVVVGVDNAPQDLTAATRLATSRLKFCTANSSSPGTATYVMELIGEPLDFLFIDAGHRYDEVKSDYDLWSKLVRPGGLIAFHDIDPNHVQWSPCDVHKFWPEVKGKRRWEFIATEEHAAYIGPAPGYGGIGIVEV